MNNTPNHPTESHPDCTFCQAEGQVGWCVDCTPLYERDDAEYADAEYAEYVERRYFASTGSI